MNNTDLLDGLNLTDPLYRIDPLTECGNILAFLDWLDEYFVRRTAAPLSLMFLDVNSFARTNAERGLFGGDIALRWIGLALKEETGMPVFHVGGDEFLTILLSGSETERTALAWKAFERLNREADQFGVVIPAASIALIHYSGSERITHSGVITQLGAALIAAKKDRDAPFQEFYGAELTEVNDAYALRWVAEWSVSQMVTLSTKLKDSQQLAYTDPTTGLPNSRAARRSLEASLASALQSGSPVTILFIDGDNLKAYNEHGYAAGDKMIRDLGKTIQDRLRPSDFVARWLMGDEFLVILPGLAYSQAVAVACRLLEVVHKASQTWLMPVTISIGVGAFPEHGNDVDLLVKYAETAQMAAKAAGKNCVK